MNKKQETEQEHTEGALRELAQTIVREVANDMAKDILRVEMTAEDITGILETIKDAIDGTSWGPLITYAGTPEEPKKIVSQVAYPLYLEIVKIMLNKITHVRIVPKSPQSDIVTSLQDI